MDIQLPSFILEQNAARQEEAFRAACAERARAYVYRVRARKAAAFQARMIALAVFTTVGTALFVGWQIASVVAWLLNN